MRALTLLTLFTLSVAGIAATRADTPLGNTSAKADFVYTGAIVLTMNNAQPEAEALAVIGNKIVFVGASADVQSYIGDKTEVFDLPGKMVLPGFVDAHEHLVASLWILSGADLFSADNKEEYIRRIKEFAAVHPENNVVQAAGWTLAGWGGTLPTAEELSEFVPDRPLFLLDSGVHDALLNSVALNRGNVTKATPDKVPGTAYWVRDEAGNPTGHALEFQWVQTFIDVGGWTPEAQIPESMSVLYGTAKAGGVTSVLIPGMGTAPSLLDAQRSNKDFAEVMALLHGLEQRDELDIRTVTMSWFKAPDAEAQETANFADRMRKQYGSDMLKVIGVKIHPESGWMSNGAPMLQPYSNKDTRGAFGVSPERMKALVNSANALGLDVAAHAEGSASTRAALDAFEVSANLGNKQARNSLHHLMWAHPDDIARVKQLDIPVNATPHFSNTFGGISEAAYELMGEKRTESMLGMYSELPPKGIRVSISPDFPGSGVEMIPPLFVIQSAITLIDPLNPEKGKFPRTRRGMTLQEALRAYTIDAAYFLRLEDKVGSLAVGKYADITVLEKDLRTVPVEEIKDVKVLSTMMDGRFTHRDGM